jgi:putative endonuclease
MYYVYLLKSKKNSSLYIGYTNDIERRVKEHNKGLVGYTKKYIPWALVYYETFLSLEDTKTREKSLKYFGKAYGQLKRRISNSLNMAKGAG